MVRKDTAKKFRAVMEELQDEVNALLSVAHAYYEDGAPATAARRLREAADKLDRIARIRQAWIDGKEEVPE